MMKRGFRQTVEEKNYSLLFFNRDGLGIQKLS